MIKQIISNCNSNNDKFECLKKMIDDDITIIENAIFTEPDDQSAWWYLQFLFSYIMKQINLFENNNDTDTNENIMEYKQWFIELLLKQIELSKSLLEVEESCKWPMITIVNIIGILLKIENNYNIDNNDSIKEERDCYIMKLIDLDPTHRNRYFYLLNN